MFQILLDIFSGKAKTKVYITFAGWMLFFHLDVIFMALFIDQNLIYKDTEMLKGEYIISYLFYYGLWWSLIIELFRIAAAALVTYLMIWVVPSLINEKSYKKELEVEYALRKMKLRKDEELNVKEERAVKKQIENLEAEKKVVAEKIKLEETPELIRWDEEYSKFRTSPEFRNFGTVIECVYRYGGKAGDMFGIPKPSSDMIAYLDSHDIVNVQNGVMTFTLKGKHFVKRYTSNT